MFLNVVHEMLSNEKIVYPLEYLIFFDDFFTFIVFQTILRNWLKDYLRKQLGDAVAPNY